MTQTRFLIPFTSVFPLCGWQHHPLGCSSLKPSNYSTILFLLTSFHTKNLPHLSNDLLWIQLSPSSSIASTLVQALSSLTRLLHSLPSRSPCFLYPYSLFATWKPKWSFNKSDNATPLLPMTTADPFSHHSSPLY